MKAIKFSILVLIDKNDKNSKNLYSLITAMNIHHHLLPGRLECKCVVLNCSRERDLGRARRVDDAMLWGPPWNEPAYEALDILSDAAAKDVLDCLNSGSQWGRLEK